MAPLEWGDDPSVNDTNIWQKLQQSEVPSPGGLCGSWHCWSVCMILVRIIVTNRKKPAVWGSTATEIFSIRQRVCLLLYNSAIDHKGHLLGEPCTTGVHQEAGQQCETPQEGRKTATLWSNATILHNIKLSSRPTCNNKQMF